MIIDLLLRQAIKLCGSSIRIHYITFAVAFVLVTKVCQCTVLQSTIYKLHTYNNKIHILMIKQRVNTSLYIIIMIQFVGILNYVQC